MLAVYDLCAVLTPCGPLKALVNLMQHEDAPEMVRTKRVLAKQ
jgi:presenilin 1